MWMPQGFCWKQTLFLFRLLSVYLVIYNTMYLIWKLRTNNTIKLNYRMNRMQNYLPYKKKMPIFLFTFCVLVLCDSWYHSILCFWSHRRSGTPVWVQQPQPQTLTTADWWEEVDIKALFDFFFQVIRRTCGCTLMPLMLAVLLFVLNLDLY